MSATRTDFVRPLKTGVTSSLASYDDGYFQLGSPVSPRFVDNGDGTITDRATNLMWIADPIRIGGGVQGVGGWNPGTHYNVGDVAQDYNAYYDENSYVCLIAHTPSIPDFTFGTYYASGAIVNGAWGQYWQSTSAHTSPTPPTYADATWYDYNTGFVYDPVGDGYNGPGYYDPGNPHTSNGASIQADIANGNYWYFQGSDAKNCIYSDYNFSPTYQGSGPGVFSAWRTANPGYWGGPAWMGSGGQLAAFDWNSALNACAAVNYAGHMDWRMPNANEALSVCDFSQGNYLNHTRFPLTGSVNNRFWTSTPDPSNPTSDVLVMSFGGNYGGLISSSYPYDTWGTNAWPCRSVI